MTLTLDTNMFISSFFWGGNPRKIIERIIEGEDELYVADGILDEVASVMARPKFSVDKESIERFIASIREVAYSVVLEGKVTNVCRDSDDDKILECALLANADYIITGDDDLLSLKEFEGIRIVTASEYLNLINLFIN
ncbi:MAG: putative toxin-antitoxin system toxin component, PIN family [Prevotellaceae bacterium]|jgi:putative PIN family toxin of toxin-antitoxin system|nr:putative toxin-antitoxin system toxin component, PIN family [Prevotellaceae bacterium]